MVLLLMLVETIVDNTGYPIKRTKWFYHNMENSLYYLYSSYRYKVVAIALSILR